MQLMNRNDNVFTRAFDWCATYVIWDPRVNKVSNELHNAAVGISMVQGGGSDGTLDDVDDDSAAQQRNRTALDKPEIMRK